MVKRLLVTAGPDVGRVFTIGNEPTILIGRSKTTPTRLTDPHVSRVHCQLQQDGEVLTLTDFESAAGTFVNGQRVNSHRLRPGDVIAIGETQMLYQVEHAGEPTTVHPDAPPPPAQPAVPSKLTDLVGKKVAHFDIGQLIAKGTTGFVFRAIDEKEKKEVALKILHPEISQNDDEMKRFVRAMKTMMPLRHPNLIAIIGAGKTKAYSWIAMEYVEGESLAAVIQRIGVAGMLDWRYALRVGIHMARALQFAEERQIIHRNITPRNILMRSSDKVFKLGDLMLAKALEGTLAQQITRPGEILGDIAYMSPERTQGTAVVDGRSDIYSLGATIYALLTGAAPFVGHTLPETVQKIRNEEPVKPKKLQLSIPDLFEGAVLQMLAKRPEKRFQKASDLLDQLEKIATFQNVAV
jgi:serine/threonine protein kinase